MGKASIDYDQGTDNPPGLSTNIKKSSLKSERNKLVKCLGGQMTIVQIKRLLSMKYLFLLCKECDLVSDQVTPSVADLSVPYVLHSSLSVSLSVLK